MRQLTYYSENPNETEVKIVDKVANVFVRTNIEKETRTNEDGKEYDAWKAIEYSAQLVATKGFVVTEEIKLAIIENETEVASKQVRAKRNELLSASDNEVLPDRNPIDSEGYVAWTTYRQALRDIPSQEGFPFDVVFPEKPMR